MREFEGTPSGITLVIGGGRPFLDWNTYCPQGENVYCVDRDPALPFGAYPHLIKGDVLKLVALCDGDVRLRGKPIAKIHADFLLNAISNEVGDRGITAADIIQNQALLLDEAFPPNVRDWFVRVMHGVINIQNSDLVVARELTEQWALQQMWRVLAVGGEIIILDRRTHIEKVIGDSTGVLQVDQETIEVTRLEIDSSDRERSNSLRKILAVWHEPIDNVGKVCLKKLEVPWPVMPKGYYRGDDLY